MFSPHSRSYEEWKSPNVDLYMDVYMFNWTNADEFLNSDSEKINLQEVGPFRFMEKRSKVNVTFNDANSTVTYYPFSEYFAVPGDISLTEEITSLDIVTVGAGDTALEMNELDKRKVSMGLDIYEKSISITKSVAEFLFDGYEDNLLTLSRTPGAIDESFMKVPEVPFDRIGWFYMVIKISLILIFFKFKSIMIICLNFLEKLFICWSA